MTTKNKILSRIANLCVLNYQKLENSGITDGKLGAIVFLYEYSRLRAAAEYSDEADTLLAELVEGLSSKTPINEIAQAGIILDYLREKGHIEMDVPIEEILDDLAKLSPGATLPFPDLKTVSGSPRFWMGFYLLAILKRQTPDNAVLSLIDKSLATIDNAYTRHRESPIALTNSVLFFINALVKRDILADKAEVAKKQLERHIAEYLGHPSEYAPGEMNILLGQISRAVSPRSGAIRKRRKNVEDNLWPDMIYPVSGRRPSIDTATVEAYIADKLDHLKTSELPKLIEIGLYLLNFGLDPDTTD